MNTYSVTFFSRCPTNGVRIEYRLKVEKQGGEPPVLVEDLIDAVSLLDRGLHEELADTLFRKFGGRQTLVAEHHGVTIETTRGV